MKAEARVCERKALVSLASREPVPVVGKAHFRMRMIREWMGDEHRIDPTPRRCIAPLSIRHRSC